MHARSVTLTLITATAGFVVPAGAGAPTATFSTLGQLPPGWTTDGNNGFAFFALGSISAAGDAISHSARVNGVYRPYVWTEANGYTLIDRIPNHDELTSATPLDVANGGNSVVGVDTTQSSASRAFRWTPTGGTVVLPTGVGVSDTFASTTTPDGSVIGGSITTIQGTFPAIFDTGEGSWSILEQIPDSIPQGEVYGISNDGSVLCGSDRLNTAGQPFVGWALTPGGGAQQITGAGFRKISVSGDGSTIAGGVADMPYRWNQSTGFEALDHVDPAFPIAEINALSFDGQIGVGVSNIGPSFVDARAAIWFADGSVQLLSDYLAAAGADLTGWTLRSADDISDDGRTIIGTGISPESQIRVWIARISEPCAADLADPFGTLNFFDISAFVSAFNNQDPSADLAEPFGTFNFFDVAEYISLYNAGCP